MSGPPLAALCTPSGRGAIATIRVSIDWRTWTGLDAVPFQAANGKPLRVQQPGRIVFGRWGREGEEDVVVCAVDRQTLEIHCHGGEAAAKRILRDLASAGCEIVGWAELLLQCESPLRAELLRELSRATTLRTAAILWEQANGVFESAIRALQSSVGTDAAAATAQIPQWLTWAKFGSHLTRPWRVVLGGQPNVGKSSLINAILGYTRSVVFDQPGTTRDIVSAETAVDGWPIELADTAGLREGVDPLESAGIERARQTLETADLALILIDVTQPASSPDRELLSQHRSALIVAHKCDLPAYQGQNEWPSRESGVWFRVSSKTGAGVDALVAAIGQRLVPHTPPAEVPIPVTERQVAWLRRARDAADESDVDRLLQCLDDLIAGRDSQPADQAPAANRKGSPATS